jgi:hypothetical protein
MLRLIAALKIARAAGTLARSFANLVILVPRDELGLAAIDHFFSPRQGVLLLWPALLEPTSFF